MARAGAVVATAPLLGGCQMVLMDPKGPIGAQEKSIILLATGLMLIVVVPVIVMTIAFAWRYRASNTSATYAPEWHHSNKIEAVVWAIPCLIVMALGSVTWASSHKLDPWQPLASPMKPIEVEVVSLDWKWLFIYPQYHIASVNQLAMPVGRPVHFRLTSATVMNSFFIPQLGSQIYTMTGMETQLNLRADHAGVYQGISANYSGKGFADMKFKTLALSKAGFNAWIAKASASKATLDVASYKTLDAPGVAATAYYGTVDPALYGKILNRCVDAVPCHDAKHVAMNHSAEPDMAMRMPSPSSITKHKS
ncbi:MAG: ubiquinol oxidase subunit II [Alphaproteobacteria bacterium]|nr:ubiquinol oxidase subunit II [Alphaproteobacteria bacterium]MDE1985635.1 ubiquinol oxidase subunit II [Alphaproteobacteria bacterium]MDE2161828.1 ubiquinol oxidase subunit II [Alphaproteobacteria bacterium]MDE2264589.1 ubiquinol oxidase subunit II [Alphaproteobacteria bacterium]MDE2499771.1 ubiquinol oxidase subunit II [Alphaproteobacteria bacterium]